MQKVPFVMQTLLGDSKDEIYSINSNCIPLFKGRNSYLISFIWVLLILYLSRFTETLDKQIKIIFNCRKLGLLLLIHITA